MVIQQNTAFSNNKQTLRLVIVSTIILNNFYNTINFTFNDLFWTIIILNSYSTLILNKYSTIIACHVTSANWIAQNMSPDSVLYHTLPCIKFLNARQSSDSRAQERESHALNKH